MVFSVYFARLVLLPLLCGYATGQDPCEAKNHRGLNDIYRSTAFIAEAPFEPLCDNRLEVAWYRFTSGAGGQMPTTCQSRQRCGTVVPLWMKGTHPTVADGIVTREVCGDYTSVDIGGEPCCDDTISISVKNCGQFYVYRLMPTTTCPAAYCAGDKAPCPVGKWSTTGFPPCKDDYPPIKTPPTLSGPNIRNRKTFDFVCKINYDQNDPDQLFEVTWTFEGVISPVPAVTVADPVREVIFEGSDLRRFIDKSVGCTVRSYYKGNEKRKSDPLSSNTYFAGIQVFPSNLEVSEKDLDHIIKLTSTLPILCDHDLECCLHNILDMRDTTDMVAVNNGFCQYKMCTTDWNDNTKTATIEIRVRAKQDMITDGNHRVTLTFRKLLPVDGGPYLDIFAGHTSQIQVDVKDQHSSVCSITGDPHIDSYDSGLYHLYKTGDFIAVQVPEKNFEIQIRNWDCWKVTCVCGVVIRERNDIIIINQCNQPWGGAHTSPTVRSVYKLSEGTVVQRSTNGGSIGVYLPSGAEVRIDVNSNYFNVYITIPGLYRGLARGICGTNDGFKENDFTHPNGIQDPYGHGSEPNNFLLSWRVQGTASMFQTNPAKIAVTDNVKYCKCTTDAAGGEIVDCSVRGNVGPTGTACQGNCPQIPVQPIAQKNIRKRSADEPNGDDEDTPDPDFVFKEVKDINPNQQWPNAQGITQQQALTMCRDAVFKSPLNTTCSTKNEMVQAVIDSCMGDILFGETTDLVEDMTHVFTVTCQMDLAQDPANYDKNEKGELIMKSEYFKDICDPQCQVHGRCGAGGQCVCNPGWEGDTCNLESGKGPQLDKIRSGSICDKSTRPCQKIYFDVTNVNLVEGLVCKAQAVDVKNTSIGEAFVAKAEFLSAFRLACTVPQSETSSQRYTISSSNNGNLYGNSLPLHVFDSTCLQCDENDCQEKKTACHIGNICYRNGVRNKNDNTEICDVSKSTTEWSKVPKNEAHKMSSTGFLTIRLGILVALRPRTYHLYKTGDFTAVQVPEKNFEVQIRNWVCWKVTCICGVVIRERNDIIIINQCNQLWGGAHTSPIIRTVYKLSEGTVIQRSANGRNIGVYLPSGVEVRVDAHPQYVDVRITTPGLYGGLGRGICGTNDGIKENDFTYPNGRQDPYVYNSQPNNFLLSWRVQGTASMFQTHPAKIAVTDNVKYCKCTTDAAGGEIVDCSVKGNVRQTGTTCTGQCQTVKVQPLAPDRNIRKRSADVNSNEPSGDDEDTPDPDFVFKEIEDINPDEQWPNAQGVTQQEALTMCTEAVFKSPLNVTCSTKNEMVQTAIDDCMSDILFGGTTDLVESMTYAFTVNCQMDLVQDPANYDKDENGELILKSEYFKDICDPQCQVHGRCGVGGQCVCNSGWEGDTCNLESGKGPQLDKIRSGSICDKSTRPCQKIYLDVTNVNFVEGLVCKAQAVDENNTGIGEAHVAEAEFLSAFRLACNVPPTVTTSQRYSISASNNGSLYGNTIPLHVFDSICLQCDENDCQQKKTACHIGNVCYKDGVKKKNDNTQICDVSKSTTEWSMAPSNDSKSTTKRPKDPTNKAYKISSTEFLTVCLGILSALRLRI